MPGIFDDLPDEVPARGAVPRGAAPAAPAPVGIFDDLPNEGDGAHPLTVQGRDYVPGDEFGSYGQSSLSANDDPNALAHAATLAANGVSLGLAPRIGAAGDTVVNAARSAFGYGPMDGTSTSYDDNLARYRGLVDESRAAHPYAGPVIEGVAGLATPIGVAGDALQAATLGGKIARGAAAGAGIGAVQGAASAPDWRDGQATADAAASGAKFGGIVGAGLPLAGAGLGAAYNAVAPALAGPLEGYGRTASNIVRGLASPRAEQRLQQLGPDAMLADASPSFTGLAGGVVTKPGPGGDVLVDALNARAAGQSDRLMADRNAALGPAMSPLEAKGAMDSRKAATGPMFEQALGSMGPVDISPVVAQVGQGLNRAVGPQRNALADLRGMLMEERMPTSGGPPIPMPISDPRTIQNAKQAIDNEISYGASPFAQPSSAAKAAQAAYSQARGGLNDALQAASPDYAAANQAYAAAARGQRSFDTGRGALGNAEEWPRDLSTRFDALPLEQQALERAGVRSDIEQQFGTNRNDLSALGRVVGDGNDFNRAKLGTYFGNDAQSALVDTLNRERTFADTANKVVQNSQSAQRLGASKLIEDASKAPEAMFPKDLTIPGIVANLGEKVVRKGFGAVASASGAATREDLGRMLQLSGAERDALLAQARSQGPRNDMLLLARLLSNPSTTRALLASRLPMR